MGQLRFVALTAAFITLFFLTAAIVVYAQNPWGGPSQGNPHGGPPQGNPWGGPPNGNPHPIGDEDAENGENGDDDESGDDDENGDDDPPPAPPWPRTTDNGINVEVELVGDRVRIRIEDTTGPRTFYISGVPIASMFFNHTTETITSPPMPDDDVLNPFYSSNFV